MDAESSREDRRSRRPQAAVPRRCRQARESLCESPAPRRAVAAHLADCAACAAFARRLELARQALARPLSSVQPDPLFPTRVAARIERPAQLIGWAAFRALPAALGLALVLAGVGWLGGAGGPRGSGWLDWLGAPPAPPVTAPPSALLLDGPPSSDQLLILASQSPEVWP